MDPAASGIDWREWWEIASYVVTVIGLPLAIWVFIAEQRKERQNDDDEVYQELSAEYTEFLKLVLEHPDLRLMSTGSIGELSDEQRERRTVLFSILISLFERAYLLVYEDEMPKQQRRLWQSWEDYMREWLNRADFREALPKLLEGEDPDFVAHITRLAGERR
ncbi:MAG TPA: hypothetical protein DCS97_15730 [Planctomycetes bacterium]|nr:hypothetical protein [Planctomycetota bacterium]